MGEAIDQVPVLDVDQTEQFVRNIEVFAQHHLGVLSGSSITAMQGVGADNIRAAVRLGARLPPYLTPRHISRTTYLNNSHWGRVPEEMAELMEQFHFFYVELQVMLVPQPGYKIPELHLQLVYNPDVPEQQRPINRDLFPKSEWLNRGQIGANFDLVLDGSIHFAAATPTIPVLLDVGAPVEAGATAEAATRAQIDVQLNYKHAIRRALVTSRGVGQDVADWVFRSWDYIERQDNLQVGVILQVPRNVRFVTVIPYLEVYFSPATLKTWFGRLFDLLTSESTETDAEDVTAASAASISPLVNSGWRTKLPLQKKYTFSTVEGE